jgi:hypothetical protein
MSSPYLNYVYVHSEARRARVKVHSVRPTFLYSRITAQIENHWMDSYKIWHSRDFVKVVDVPASVKSDKNNWGSSHGAFLLVSQALTP